MKFLIVLVSLLAIAYASDISLGVNVSVSITVEDLRCETDEDCAMLDLSCCGYCRGYVPLRADAVEHYEDKVNSSCKSISEFCLHDKKCEEPPVAQCTKGLCTRPIVDGCLVSGCSGEVCAPFPLATICIAPSCELQCKLDSSTCTPHLLGCGWNVTNEDKYKACLKECGNSNCPQCLINPCSLNPRCPAHPNARCVPNDCDCGFHFEEDGKEVDCTLECHTAKDCDSCIDKPGCGYCRAQFGDKDLSVCLPSLVPCNLADIIAINGSGPSCPATPIIQLPPIDETTLQANLANLFAKGELNLTTYVNIRLAIREAVQDAKEQVSVFFDTLEEKLSSEEQVSVCLAITTSLSGIINVDADAMACVIVQREDNGKRATQAGQVAEISYDSADSTPSNPQVPPTESSAATIAPVMALFLGFVTYLY